MFAKLLSSATVILALLSQVNAHAAIAPALGVKGTLVRGNVQRPSAAKPCGNVNIANTINTSTAVTANTAGQFTTTVTNFNAGADGSRRVTAKVDATGKGTKFVAVTVRTNGIAAPSNVGSQQIVASLPAGIKCTGGSTRNKCLVQFVTSAGFGNCVVVSKPAAAAVKGRAAAGSRAARALLAELAELEARAEEGLDVVKRQVSSWLWA